MGAFIYSTKDVNRLFSAVFSCFLPSGQQELNFSSLWGQMGLKAEQAAARPAGRRHRTIPGRSWSQPVLPSLPQCPACVCCCSHQCWTQHSSAGSCPANPPEPPPAPHPSVCRPHSASIPFSCESRLNWQGKILYCPSSHSVVNSFNGSMTLPSISIQLVPYEPKNWSCF